MLQSTLLTLVVAACASALPQFSFPIPPSDGTSGSGKYPSNYSTDATLPDHTIYAPISPPAGIKLPVILFMDGECMDQGLGFRNFINDIASHGYYIIVAGAPRGTGQAKNSEMTDALNWVTKNPKPYVDATKIAASGQSCGGFGAYSISTDKRITLTTIFDSGNIGGEAYDVTKFHAPIAYFLGGTTDIAYSAGKGDFAKVKVPAALINNPTGGHMNTYMDKEGGISGVAAVAWFDWQMKNSTAGYTTLTSKDSVLGKAGWQITLKNGLGGARK